MSKKIILTGIIAVLALAFIIVACSDKAKDSPTIPQFSPTTKIAAAVDPVVIDPANPGGNVECSEVGSYQYSSGRINYTDGAFDADFPEGFTVTTDGIYVSWSFNLPGYYICGMAVIVKGGPNANVYIYEDPHVQADNGLVSPINPNNDKPYGLSNLTFCYNLCEEEECEWIGETAWAAGDRYVSRGNWATYTPYAEGTVTLYAGQYMEAGTVSFSAVSGDMVTITITLNAGWRFEDVEENVKIQDYATAPSGNPAPGLFDWKGYATGSSFSIDVPANNFYGVHVNVEWEKCE